MPIVSFQANAGRWTIIADKFINGPGLQVFLNGQLVAAKSYGNSNDDYVNFTHSTDFAFLTDEMRNNPGITVREIKGYFRLFDKIS